MKQEKHPLQTQLYQCIKAITIDNLVEDDKQELLQLFNVTENALIRNHIALIFSDIQFNVSVKKIIQKILSGKYDDNVGTLVYALEGLECKKEFISIIKILCEKNYEARMHAFEIIEKYAELISKRTRAKSLNILEKAKIEQEKSASEKGENSPLHFIEQTIQLLKQ